MSHVLSPQWLDVNEHVVWIGKTTLKSLWLPFILGIATFALYGIGTLFILYAIVKWLRITYVITTKRVAVVKQHYSFLRHGIQEIERSNIRSIYSTQSSIGKRLGYWNLYIKNNRTIVFNGIGHPIDIKRLIEKPLNNST